MFGAAVGLPAAGISVDDFNPAAPIAGCRLCGAVYQTKQARQLYNARLWGFEDKVRELTTVVLSLNSTWRTEHEKTCKNKHMVEELKRTGAAFTAEAANKLSPFGIIPLGNMSQEIMDGMFEADRKPDLTLLEGGE